MTFIKQLRKCWRISCYYVASGLCCCCCVLWRRSVGTGKILYWRTAAAVIDVFDSNKLHLVFVVCGSCRYWGVWLYCAASINIFVFYTCAAAAVIEVFDSNQKAHLVLLIAAAVAEVFCYNKLLLVCLPYVYSSSCRFWSVWLLRIMCSSRLLLFLLLLLWLFLSSRRWVV